jgi:competence protein ComGF
MATIDDLLIYDTGAEMIRYRLMQGKSSKRVNKEGEVPLVNHIGQVYNRTHEQHKNNEISMFALGKIFFLNEFDRILR